MQRDSHLFFDKFHPFFNQTRILYTNRSRKPNNFLLTRYHTHKITIQKRFPLLLNLLLLHRPKRQIINQTRTLLSLITNPNLLLLLVFLLIFVIFDRNLFNFKLFNSLKALIYMRRKELKIVRSGQNRQQIIIRYEIKPRKHHPFAFQVNTQRFLNLTKLPISLFNFQLQLISIQIKQARIILNSQYNILKNLINIFKINAFFRQFALNIFLSKNIFKVDPVPLKLSPFLHKIRSYISLLFQFNRLLQNRLNPRRRLQHSQNRKQFAQSINNFFRIPYNKLIFPLIRLQ